MKRFLAQTISRRNVIWSAVAAAVASKPMRAAAQPEPVLWSYPMGLPGGVLGDGCGIFHGYACENIPFYPGLWHTGENWHLNDGETGGTPIFAVADGEVVYAGSDYPGLVIVIQHGAESFSMYGHLNVDSAVAMGAKVQRGEQIGSVLTRTDGRLSHLHFEIRTFLMTREVNGDTPRHTFNCGYECPPGPGYWPMSDPDHPSVMGWRNPTCVVGSGLWADFGEVVVSSSAGDSVSV
ncbi:MAG: M23 family metallopeptidase, partial [Thermomicrobiales bacterium]